MNSQKLKNRPPKDFYTSGSIIIDFFKSIIINFLKIFNLDIYRTKYYERVERNFWLPFIKEQDRVKRDKEKRDQLIKENTKPDFNDWKLNISNDFESYVFKYYPKVQEIKDKMESAGSLFTQMSGTGSTVYGFFESIEKAEYADANMPDEYLTFISVPLEI